MDGLDVDFLQLSVFILLLLAGVLLVLLRLLALLRRIDDERMFDVGLHLTLEFQLAVFIHIITGNEQHTTKGGQRLAVINWEADERRNKYR